MSENVTRDFLEDMRAVRERTCRVRANDPFYEPAKALQKAIDDMAGALTGDREYFWSQSSSIG